MFECCKASLNNIWRFRGGMKVNMSVCVCFGFYYPLKEVSTRVEACLLPVKRLMYIIQLVSAREVRRLANLIKIKPSIRPQFCY